MIDFVHRHAASVTGVLSGFDRLWFRGTLRRLANAAGMRTFLSYVGVLLKDAGQYMERATERVKSASVAVAEAAGRPVLYLADPSARKEDLARGVAERDGVKDGLVCVLKAVEPCRSFDVHRNARAKKLELVPRRRQCLHLYHYLVHPDLGLAHVRLQTWFPFNTWVCLNGREWLCRQLDAAGVGYVRRDNCLTDVRDVAEAQALLDGQLKTDWPGLLGGLAAAANPAHDELFGPASAYPIDYYWSAQQTEWATDVMFKSPAALAGVYPSLVRHATQNLGSRDVLRFLGRAVPRGLNARRDFSGQVATDLKERPEGLRVKHRVNANSVKLYDKQGSVLRVETTVNDARDIRVYRGVEGRPAAPMRWRRMRKGVCDLHRRAEVSQAANDRYLEALASAHQPTALKDLASPLCRPVRWKGGRARAINPLNDGDARLLAAVARGEFTVNGFRNRDLRGLLFRGEPREESESRRRSGVVTRKLRLLRGHGLIRKVAKTHRYLVTPKGREAITALLAAREADAAALMKAA